MHRTIGFLSKRLAQIHPGEGRKVLLTFCYFFLVITAYYIIKPVSRSLVLGELGARMVPYVDLVCAVLMGPVVTLFARLVDRMSKPRLVSLWFFGVIIVLLVFWQLLAWPIPWIAGAFYVWVAIFSVLVVTLFWLVSNDLYTPREARRLFGFIGSGGILGGIVGSSLAAVGAQVVGTQHLLLLSAALLVGCWWLVQHLWRLAPQRPAMDSVKRPAPRRETAFANLREFANLLLQSRYLLLLVGLVGLNKLVSSLLYYQLNTFIEQGFPEANARTTFTGLYFGAVNVLAFVIQFCCTSWILRRWGLRVALMALPIGALMGSSALLFFPIFWVAVATELYDASMNYSLQQTTKEVLYLPIDRSIRYKVKPFIDMVVFRVGKGVAAIVGIVLFNVLILPPRYLNVLVVPLLLVWLVLAVSLRREYIVTIRTMLQARAISRRASPPAASTGSSTAQTNGEPSGPPVSAAAASAAIDALFSSRQPGKGLDASTESVERFPVSGEPGPFGSLTESHCVEQKLALLDRLITTTEPRFPSAKELLQELKTYETSFMSATEPGEGVAQLKTLIRDDRESIAARRQAIRAIARVADQAVVDYLLGIIMVEEDAVLRREAVVGLVRLRLFWRRFEFPPPTIRGQIAKEVAIYQRIVHVAAIYRQQVRTALTADDPVVALLRLLAEEAVEQVFRLLMLLYRPEDIHLIYEQLRTPDTYVRSDAIELLDNLIDPAIRTVIFPILDENRFLSILEEGPPAMQDPVLAYRVLQEAIWNHHRWLSITTLCAIGRLRLTTMHLELEKASRHAPPLVSTAAKVAIHLATHA